LSQFGTVFNLVNPFPKLLKTIAFISQKSLDTPVFRLIRFPQKVLTEFKPPLELFSLEEKAAQLPGGLFALDIFSAVGRESIYFELLCRVSAQPWSAFHDCIERIAGEDSCSATDMGAPVQVEALAEMRAV
jgi:hypothetical protein